MVELVGGGVVVELVGGGVVVELVGGGVVVELVGGGVVVEFVEVAAAFMTTSSEYATPTIAKTATSAYRTIKEPPHEARL